MTKTYIIRHVYICFFMIYYNFFNVNYVIDFLVNLYILYLIMILSN